MKGMILCAGLGTRLRPLTEHWPKPAMPLLGQPLLRYALAVLRRAGVQSVGINTHHLPDRMAAVAQDECARLGWPLQVVHEPVIQGTGGGIRGLRSFLSDDHFVVLNGDVLFAVDLEPIAEVHRASGAAATMVVLPMPADEAYAAVEADAQGKVRRIAGQGPGGDRLMPWHFTGIHLMSPAVFDFMRPTGAEDINRQVYVRMLEQGLSVQVYPVDPSVHYWSDMGTPKRYLAAHQQLLFGQVSMRYFAGGDPFESAIRQGMLWAHPSARLGDVRVSGPAMVGEGAQLGAGVRLGAGVSIGREATIGDGASLNRVAVLDGAQVAAGAQLEDCLVGPNMPPIAVR